MPLLEAQVLIVGAGLSGLMAATLLQENGVNVILIDKGRSVGGRLATRRIGPGKADHGAQFFTVRHQDFEQWVYRWLSKGLAFRWSTGWSNGSTDVTGKPEGYPRYAIHGGMNALAKNLAQGLNTVLNVRLTAVSCTANGWLAGDEQGNQYASQSIILTAPVPQSLALLEASAYRLPADELAALQRIEYNPCLAGLLWVDGPVNLPNPGAIQQPQQPICWIADNRQKGISPQATLITAHGGPEFSRRMWDKSTDEILQAIIDNLAPFFTSHTTIIEAQLKRWRYSAPTTLHPERCMGVFGLPPIIFAGDAFGEPRVEGAALSGMATANKLLSLIKHHSVYNDGFTK